MSKPTNTLFCLLFLETLSHFHIFYIVYLVHNLRDSLIRLLKFLFATLLIDPRWNQDQLVFFYAFLIQALHLKGVTYAQIAGIIGRSIVTIANYVKAYREGGLVGLNMGQSPGRPTFLKEEQEQALYQLIVEQRPSDVGFPAKMNWNAPLVRDWVERKFGVKFSERGMRQLLYRLGFSYTKPTYTLAKADPEKQETFKQEFEMTKKNNGWKCFVWKRKGTTPKSSCPF